MSIIKNYATKVPAHMLMSYTESKQDISDESGNRTINVRTPVPRGYLLMTDGEGGVEYVHPSSLIIGEPGKSVRKNW